MRSSHAAALVLLNCHRGVITTYNVTFEAKDSILRLHHACYAPMSQKTKIAQTVARKLNQVLGDADALTLDKMRGSLTAIGPSPTCPPVDAVMKAIHHALAEGSGERRRVAKEAVLATLTPISAKLNKKDLDAVMGEVNKAFPGTALVGLADGVPGIYERRLAPAGKFQERAYELERALMSATAANSARRTVADIQLALDEVLLHQILSAPRVSTRLLTIVGKLTFPPVKWVIRIITAVLIAVLVKVVANAMNLG